MQMMPREASGHTDHQSRALSVILFDPGLGVNRHSATFHRKRRLPMRTTEGPRLLRVMVRLSGQEGRFT